MLGFALSALGFVKRAMQAAFAAAMRYPWQAALIAALLACAWFAWGKGKAIDQRDAAREQVALWKDANAKATAWALAEKAAKEAAANDITKGANDARSIAKAAGARAGDDYASRNRCLRVTAPESRGERPDMSGAVSVAGQPESAPGNAELVGVSRPDFNACTAAALDLDNAAQWAADMVAKGLAR